MKKKYNVLVILAVMVLPFSLLSQGLDTYEASFEENYQSRIEKEYLFDVYIPEDITDAFLQLNKLIDADSREKFIYLAEEAATRKLHFSLGRWMIYNWQFYEGSRLSHHLKELGLSHPDDMARFIITTYHRSLNKKPLEVKALIEELVNARKAKILERRQNGKVLHEETRVRSADSGGR
jgi:hypothetical protein